ncbi:MAG: hemolysin family protein [Lachnospiraceae bacterium]|nr:hemolysin family protein [Lachnospiraceae bacterium]
MDNPLPGILIMLVFVVITGVLNCFSGALSVISESLIEKKKEKKPKQAARVLHIMEKPERVQEAVFFFVLLMCLAVGVFIYPGYVEYVRDFLADRIGTLFTGSFVLILSHVLVILYMMLILLVLGVFLPENIGRRYPSSAAFATVGPVRLLLTVSFPFRAVTAGLSRLILSLFGADGEKKEIDTTEDEIKSMVNEGHEKGVIEASEAEMITNIFEFGDKMAKDIMTHRKNIVAVDGDMTLSEASELILNENNSRYPVYVEDIDNIIGILHLKTAMIFLKQQGMGERKVKDIPELLQEAVFIPETRNINVLFRDMQLNKIHMEIVMDEYGQTAGLVAMEDILEVIFGSILDEYDEDENYITPCEDGTYLALGMTPLENLEDELGLSFENEEDIDTLNGFLTSKLDRILSEEDRPILQIDGTIYEILKVENNLISEVRITPKTEEPEETDADEAESTKKDAKESAKKDAKEQTETDGEYA